MVRRHNPSNSLLSPMRRLLLRMSPTMLPKRRRVRRIMAMVHTIQQRKANQPSHSTTSSKLLHRRSLRLHPTSRISHHTTKQPASQPRATAQASHTTTHRSPSNSQVNSLSSCQRQQLTHPAHKLAQTHHRAMRAPTQALVNPPHNPTSHNRAATMARPMPTRSSRLALLPWLLPAQTLAQQASQTPPSR